MHKSVSSTAGTGCASREDAESGELVRYDLLLRYGDTLIYSQQLSLLRVMDLLVDRYLGDPS